jgi:hypothetical protein
MGLEIRYCKDIRSYKKLIPALREFPNEILITADDDVYYPRNWLEGFKRAYYNDTSKIYCYRAHGIVLEENGEIAPYETWENCVNINRHTSRLFPTGVGGILYPPHSLGEKCLNEEEFMALAPDADDIWFWAMAKCMGTKHEIIENRTIKRFRSIDPEENLKGLWVKNTKTGGNNRQIKAIIERFPDIKEKLK